jgi:trehalose-phosphatase
MQTTGLGDDVVPIYIGDDDTDEDAFAAIRDDGIAVVVGDDDHRETSAHFRLANTEEVRLFLCQLNDRDEEAT